MVAIPGRLNIFDERATHDAEVAVLHVGAAEADAVAVAQRFGDQLGLAAANVRVMASAAELARQLQVAMESRATIEQAKGIIMAANRCSPDAAFDILRRASQNRNRKLRDIASDIVERTQRDLPS